MLKRLRIENFLTIKNITLHFSRSLNAIHGESGAGKSLILKALASLFSQRMTFNPVGNFADTCRVSALFEISGSQRKLLEEATGIDSDELLIEKVFKNDRSRLYINREPASARVGKLIGDTLVNILSQDYRYTAFDSQNLIGILDRFIDRSVLENYKGVYERYTESLKQIESLQRRLDKINSLHPEILIEAIEKVNPQEDEYERLLEESRRMKALGTVKDELYRLINELYESEHSVETTVAVAQGRVEKIAAAGFQMDECLEGMEQIVQLLDQMKDRLYRMTDLDVTQERIDQVESRLFELEELQRRFAKPVNEIVKERDRLKALIEDKELLKEELKELEKKKQNLYEELIKQSETLSQHRRAAADTLRRRMLDFLTRMGLESSKVEFHFEKKSPSEDGSDRISVMFSANPDLAPGPIEKIASGGERARFILAMEASVSRDSRQGNTLVLDEIESGISGNTLDKLSALIKELGQGLQIVMITHTSRLVEIADKAFEVKKSIKGGLTESWVENTR